MIDSSNGTIFCDSKAKVEFRKDTCETEISSNYNENEELIKILEKNHDAAGLEREQIKQNISENSFKIKEKIDEDASEIKEKIKESMQTMQLISEEASEKMQKMEEAMNISKKVEERILKEVTNMTNDVKGIINSKNMSKVFSLERV